MQAASTNLYGKPSLTLKLVTSFTHVIDMMISIAIEEGNGTVKRNCEELKHLFNIRWTGEVTANAHHTQVGMKRNVISIVPLTEDVTRMK